MIGVIAGDVIGSVHEHALTKSTDFPLFDPRCRFTDDTVLTIATAYAVLTRTPYEAAYRDFGRQYPDAGYGGSFYDWLMAAEPRPYNSWGNGSAMRVVPVGFAFGNVDDVLSQAELSAAVTHNHEEGIKGAQATALAVFMARSGASKDDIRQDLVQRFGYNLHRTVEEIRPQAVDDTRRVRRRTDPMTVNPPTLRLENRHTGEVLELWRERSGGEMALRLRGGEPDFQRASALEYEAVEGFRTSLATS